MKKIYKLLLASVLQLSFLSAFAQPSNDECSGAVALSVATNTASCTVTTATTTAATQSTVVATLSGCWFSSNDDDVWYSFVATASNIDVQISNRSNTTEEIGYSLFSGSCSSLTEVKCDNSPNLFNFTGLTIGQTYYMAVFYLGTSVRGTFDVCVYQAPPPPPAPSNDECSGAIALSVGSACTSPTVGDVAGATLSNPTACTGTATDDVWYSFVATAATNGIKVTGSSSFDAVISLYSSCASNTEIKCEDNDFNLGGIEYLVGTGLTIGQTYFVRVYDYYSAAPATTTFTICASASDPMSIEDTDANGFSLYPNPTSGMFTLNSIENLNNATVTVFDIKGQVVYSVVNSVSNKLEIDLNNHTNGVYYIQINNNDNVITKKIVKQ
ncbi:MAG: T9SS type A sorting domain-containing protein [Bacteroidetes bacterium]|nr:T9SS type A sorting domain-containing protein [Bacteroidota bacterium]